MDHLQYSEAIRRDGAALATAAGHAGVDGRVPSCPEWTVADLLGHVGRIHRWVTAIVEQRPGATEHHWSESEPPAVEKRIEWFAQGLDPLADALAAADPATEVWSWTDDHSVGSGRLHCSVVGEPASGEGLLDAEFDGTDDGRR